MVSNIVDNIAQIGKVKTLFNPDTIVDLHDIISAAPPITFRHFKLVDKICSINRTKVLIEGGPGQGKSIVNVVQYVIDQGDQKNLTRRCRRNKKKQRGGRNQAAGKRNREN